MEAKHTKGPWRIDGRKIVGADTYADVDGFQVAEVTHEGAEPRWSRGISIAEAWLNAALISNAPDLLAFAKQEFAASHCTCKFLGYVGKEPPCPVCKLETLIAKAEGRE